MVIKMELREKRIGYNISQQRAADIVGIPLRTYVRYEDDDNYGDSLKRKAIINAIDECCEINEDKGILSLDAIKTAVKDLFDSEYKGEIEFCYLFGSYAKGYAKDKSDVDLCVSTNLSGLDFAGLSEKLRNVLHKRINLIRLNNLKDNVELINEIMRDGIKIY